MSDAAATCIEPLGCVIRGLRQAGAGPGTGVAVVGAGAMGLLYVQAARALGAGPVAAVEPRRRPAGPGRSRPGRPSPDGRRPRGRERRRWAAELADAVFVCTSKPEAIAGALALAGPAGVVQLFAPTPPGQAVGLDLGAIFFREVTLQSTYSAGPFDTRDALAMIASGRVDAEGLVSHRLPLGRVEEAFALARSGEATKVVVEP